MARPIWRNILVSSIALSAICFFASPALAQKGGIDPQFAIDREFSRVSEILDDSQSTWFKPINADPYAQFKENLKERTGFEYSTYYTLMNHYATKGGSNLNGQVHTINAWTPRHGCPNAGTAIFYYMSVGQITQRSASQVSDNLGLSSSLNDSAINLDLFRFVGWYQPYLDGDIEFYLGQINMRDLFEFGDYATDDTRNFISEIMSGNPAATLPAPGLSLATKLRLAESFYVGGGVADANARPGDLWNFQTATKGNYASVLYLNFKPNIGGLGQGNYQFNVYSVDGTNQAPYSRGLSMILEQDIGERYATFFKYHTTDKRRTANKQTIATAILKKGVYKWKDDLLGFGGGWGDPTDSARHSEYVLEAFWRMQVAPGIQFTPNIELWLNPSQTPGTDTQAVFSFRYTADL